MADHEYDFSPAPGVTCRLRYMTEGHKRSLKHRFTLDVARDSDGTVLTDADGDPIRVFEESALSEWNAETIKAGLVSVSGLTRKWPAGVPIVTADDFVEHAPGDVFNAVASELRSALSLLESEKKSSPGSPASSSAEPARSNGTAVSVPENTSPSAVGASDQDQKP
jgi:hypothetical protein